jgi:hypothetical protein
LADRRDVAVFVKRRGVPEPGSIPAVLDMFRSEVRFYREIAPMVGVRVPACYRAAAGEGGTLLELEDLSAWSPGADLVELASLLAGLHRRWEDSAARRWPWLRPAGAAADLVGALYDRTWSELSLRVGLPPRVRALGDSLVGRVAAMEGTAASAGPWTLVHGDASTRNVRTSGDGVVALLDWEDVSAAPGVTDLAWLLVSSVEPARWDEVIRAYGDAGGRSGGLRVALPAAAVQGLLSFSAAAVGSAEATGWLGRLEAAAVLCPL